MTERLLAGPPNLLETAVRMRNGSLWDENRTYDWTHSQSHGQMCLVFHAFYGVALYQGKHFQVQIVVQEQTHGERFYEKHTFEAE